MLDNLSQPVAFATAPLGKPDAILLSGTKTPPLPPHKRRDGNMSSDTDPDEPMFSRFTRRIGISREGSSGQLGNGASSSSSKSKPSSQDDFDDDIFEDGGGYCFLSVLYLTAV